MLGVSEMLKYTTLCSCRSSHVVNLGRLVGLTSHTYGDNEPTGAGTVYFSAV
jgi:hypothetical protein